MNLQITIPDEVLKDLYSGLEARLFKRLEQIEANREIIPNNTTKYLTRKESADKLKISLPTIHNWIKSGKLKINRIGRRVLIDESDLNQFVRDSNND